MKKLLSLMLLITLLLSACSESSAPTELDLDEMKWEDITAEAAGTEVHIFMWGGDDGINSYIDDLVAPNLKEAYDIELVRHPMDAADFISKLLTEKKAGKEEGTIDMIWINGENFKNAKDNDLLYGSFAQKLPNVNDHIGNKPYVENDMGTKIDGLEAPWGKVQFVFNYDETKVKNPPATIAELIQWAKDNPGEFTYPNVSDFSGNAFVRHLLYEAAKADPEAIQSGFNEEWLQEHGANVWTWLNEFEGSLWREGKTYPESLAQLDQLYSKGEVAFTMGFNERRTASLIADGIFPESTKTLVLEPGSIGNTHYLSIPFNSPNKAGALTAINYFLSPEAQIAKLDPTLWGEGTVLDPETLSEAELNEMTSLGGETVVKSSDILPELDAKYADWIKEHWENEVVQQ